MGETVMSLVDEVPEEVVVVGDLEVVGVVDEVLEGILVLVGGIVVGLLCGVGSDTGVVVMEVVEVVRGSQQAF